MKVLLFLLLSLFCLTNAVDVWVDADTGEMVFERPANPALWPDGKGSCSESLDAVFIEHSNRYEKWEQFYIANEFGYKKMIATAVSIYDLQQCATQMHSAGVWHNNLCDVVTHDFSHQIVKPLMAAMRDQNRGSMTSRLWGFVYEMQCQSPNDGVYKDEVHTCRDGNEVRAIMQGAVSQIHAIRADAEKRR